MPAPPIELIENDCFRASEGFGACVVKLTLTRGPGPRGYAPPPDPSLTRIVVSTAQQVSEAEAARLLAAVQRGLVGVLFALKDPRRKAVPRASLAFAGLAYDAAQVLAFPLHASLGWSRTASLGWLQAALAFRNPFAAAESTVPAVQAAVVARRGQHHLVLLAGGHRGLKAHRQQLLDGLGQVRVVDSALQGRRLEVGQ
jgi:hypothetical protein